MRHNKITSRKSHYGEHTIKNLISASNCLSGLHSVTWGLRTTKKAPYETGTFEKYDLKEV